MVPDKNKVEGSAIPSESIYVSPGDQTLEISVERDNDLGTGFSTDFYHGRPCL